MSCKKEFLVVPQKMRFGGKLLKSCSLHSRIGAQDQKSSTAKIEYST